VRESTRAPIIALNCRTARARGVAWLARRRLGEVPGKGPDDLLEVVSFLASDESS
jgi:hypothetical protein